MTPRHARHRILKAVPIAFLACLFCAPGARAQDERKIDATKERIHRLAEEAKELRERGRVNEAEKLLQEVKKLKRWLAKATHGRSHGSEDYHHLLGNLKQAIHLLKELDRHEHAEKLAHFTEELYADLQRRRKEHEGWEHDERAEAKRQLRVLRYAKGAFAEAGKKDALDMIERAMHARKLQSEGRRDREARQIIARAPGRENVIELLGWAAKILAEYGARDKATAVKGLAGQMMRRGREHGRREGERSEREAARHQIEVIQLASRVLDKADRGDAAERMEHAAKALALRLEGARGDEAERFISRAPDRGEIAELLGLTTEILQDRGQRDRAEMVAKVARQFSRARERGREPGRKRQLEGRRHRRTDAERRMNQLTERLEHMARVLEELQEQIHRLKRQTR